MNVQKLHRFEDRIISESRVARLHRRSTIGVIRAALRVPPELWTDKKTLRTETRKQLQRDKTPGNILIIIAIMGIIINLVWQWWLHHNTDKPGAIADLRELHETAKTLSDRRCGT